MSNDTVLEFDKLPPVGPAYLRALTASGGGLAGDARMPAISAHMADLGPDENNLARYNRVCGFSDGGTLPSTYPHVLAFPMHMAVMTHREFPFKLMGLVHVRNSITQHRAIGTSEALTVNVALGGHRQVPKGIEFDLVTEVQGADSEYLWQSTSTMLSLGGGSGKRSGSHKSAADDVPEGGQAETWHVPAGTGRRYARAAGDVNPIHLSALSAKLFGFPRAIAHGMWLKAHAIATMADSITSDRYSVNVAFKKPVLLPSQVQLIYGSPGKEMEFALQNARGDVTHMLGTVSYP